MGSIAGTFLPAMVTIPLIGTQRTMLAAALLLTIAAVALLGMRAVPVVVLVAGLIAVPPGAIRATSGLLFETDSSYQFIRVVDQADGHRDLQTNEGVSAQSVWRPDTVLTGGEWDMFLVVPPLLDRPVKRVLLIGSAGGTAARAYAALYPGVVIDAVELDPAVTAAGRTYMGLAGIPRLTTIADDGRNYLRRTERRYDVIAVDAYRLDYIPFYMATQEFFRLCRQHLTSGGALAVNVARVPGDQRLGDAVAGTMATEFAQTWRWPALRFNELVVGLDRGLTRSQLTRRAASLPPALASLSPLLARDLVSVAPSSDPMTDDRAPVEWLSDRMYLEQIARGRGLDEHYLPTHP
jgi:spermidine synthase